MQLSGKHKTRITATHSDLSCKTFNTIVPTKTQETKTALKHPIEWLGKEREKSNVQFHVRGLSLYLVYTRYTFLIRNLQMPYKECIPSIY